MYKSRKVIFVKLLFLIFKENIVMSDMCLSSVIDIIKVGCFLDGDFLKKVKLIVFKILIIYELLM